MSGLGLNDFVIKIGMVNGMGLVSVNGLLMKLIFWMGILVVGKNVFLLNIQGLLIWYEICVFGDGYVGCFGEVYMMVVMNQVIYDQDFVEFVIGGVLFYDSIWLWLQLENWLDVIVIGVLFMQMCNEVVKVVCLCILMKNMVYVGVVVVLVDIDFDVICLLIEEIFVVKVKLIDSNMEVVKFGYDYVKVNYECLFCFCVVVFDKISGKVMIDGNMVVVFGCVYVGVIFGVWYLIILFILLMDGFVKYCKQLCVNEEMGKNKYCIIQVEDELVVVGLIIGVVWNGVCVFMLILGFGILLMSEWIGFVYYIEVFVVFFDIQCIGLFIGMLICIQ